MNGAKRELIAVLRAAKALLAFPDNCFTWSPWNTAEDAFEELNSLIVAIESGVLPDRMKVKLLFGPTGSIQEVSIGSGWGTEFLELAKRFDAAESRVYDKCGVRLKSLFGYK